MIRTSPVFRRLGKKGPDPDAPPIGQILARGDIGYHNRAGGHSVERYDGMNFLEFAERHLRP